MKKPSIRFQEFNDEWKVQSFGTYINECNELTSDKVKYPLYSLTIEEGVVPKPERYEREHLITKERDSYKIVPSNAFVYNPMNLRFGALKVNHENFPVCVSGYYNVFLMGNEETLKFWENYLLTDKMLNYYYSIATGSLIEKLRVHFSQFVDIKKPIPSLEEQKKISSLFNNIDDVISTIEAEIELWEEKKKGVMQKIFSQEVRFKKEDGSNYPEWEEKTFADVFESFEYGMNTAATDYDGVNKYIRITDIDDTSHKYLINNTVSPLGKLDDKYLVNENDILFARTGASTGKSYLYRQEDGKLYFAGFLIRGHVKSEFNSFFIFVQTITEQYDKWVKVMSIRSGQPGINASEYALFKFPCPCFKEQCKIAELLSTIDEVIQTKKQKLEKWKNIKKGLLQQMFV